MKNGYWYYFHNIITVFSKRHFKGWGRKKTGRFALMCQYLFGGKVTLYEDGFIRSVGLGIEGSPSFSIVEDDIGIYYDATVPSRLENILNSYDFDADSKLMATAEEAIALIRQHRISKYNDAPDVNEGYFDHPDFCGRDPEISHGDESNSHILGNDDNTFGRTKRVLIVAQTAGDASLLYGMADRYSTDEMIDSARREHPDAEIWLKIHPDVMAGKKRSDIAVEDIGTKGRVITENFSSISVLEHFDAVYTKTSQMGFEALILGKQCVCFGMPFYAGWGLTDDRVLCERRNRHLKIEELFAAAYILYTHYYNPYRSRSSDIIDTIREIVKQRSE